jgi:hypothetical protein
MTPKRPRDPNQLAKSIIDIATGQQPSPLDPSQGEGKDPAAVERGRRGGPARAAKLTSDQRSAIAKKAAKTRWE